MTPQVTIYVITYNEEIMIEFFINHYRRNFPNCIIHVYDNYSTDKTAEIAESMGCIVHKFETDGFDDDILLYIKSNKWKDATTDWVIVCDCDELIEINQEELYQEASLGYDILNFEGYTLMNKENNIIDLNNMKYGFRDVSYDKYYLFNKNRIVDIGYNYGCHKVNRNQPKAITGDPIIGSSKIYRALHYKYLSLEYCINRRKMLSIRISEFNRQRGFTQEYIHTEEILMSTPHLAHLSINHIFESTELTKILN